MSRNLCGDVLEAIWLHTRQQWGVEQADRYVNRLAREFADLVLMPQAAVACEPLICCVQRARVQSFATTVS